MADLHDLEGMEIEVLEDWIENGMPDDESFPEEIKEYLAQLELVRGQILREKSKDFIVNLLKSHGLSDYVARKRYADAVNFFYADDHIRKEAWGNYYAERLEKISALATAQSKTIKDLEIAKNILLAAMEARVKFRPAELDVPAEVFNRPNKIYSTDVRVIGLEKVSRREVAALIDSYDIPGDEKKRLRAEATVDNPQLILDNSDHDK